MSLYDCIVIGAGPAGLSAAIYMARYNRSVIVVDKGSGRASGKQINENYLGFPQGIRASRLLDLGREQAKHFGVKFIKDEVLGVKKGRGQFEVKITGKKLRSKTLIIATGVTDHYPAFPGLFAYLGTSLFWCITCDGYKVRNKRLVVVGHDDKATITAAEFLLFTDKITFLTNCEVGGDEITKEGYARLKKAGIKVVFGSIKKVHGKNGRMSKINLDNGISLPVDFMFSKQGYTPNGKLAAELHAVIEGEGFIKVDKDQKTNIEGLYAAGDVTSEAAHQIATAVHQGSVAATNANEYLLKSFQK